MLRIAVLQRDGDGLLENAPPGDEADGWLKDDSLGSWFLARIVCAAQ